MYIRLVDLRIIQKFPTHLWIGALFHPDIGYNFKMLLNEFLL